MTALAAMQEGLLSPYQAIQCTPFSVYGRDKQVFNNWNPFVNEAMTLPTALAASCDTYFYEVGNRFYNLPERRGQPLQRWARTFGFGQPSGLDVGGEDGGLLPTIRWKRQTYTKERYPKTWQVERLWKPGDSIQLAIGQKDLLVTPLQMTRFYALLQNGGRLVTPHLVSSVEQPGIAGRPSVVLQRFPPTPPRDTNVSADALASIEEGLRGATSAAERHLGRRLRQLPGPDLRQDRNGREVVERAAADARPVLVVRLRRRVGRRSRRSRSAC